MINHAIGASGVVSQECKSVVEKYGTSIMDLLLKEVQPDKICAQVGACAVQGPRLVLLSPSLNLLLLCLSLVVDAHAQ